MDGSCASDEGKGGNSHWLGNLGKQDQTIMESHNLHNIVGPTTPAATREPPTPCDVRECSEDGWRCCRGSQKRWRLPIWPVHKRQPLRKRAGPARVVKSLTRPRFLPRSRFLPH